MYAPGFKIDRFFLILSCFIAPARWNPYICHLEKNVLLINCFGAIAQLARALAWHARGPGFDSP